MLTGVLIVSAELLKKLYFSFKMEMVKREESVGVKY